MQGDRQSRKKARRAAAALDGRADGPHPFAVYLARAPSAQHLWAKGLMAKGWSKELKEEEQLAGDESDSDGMGGLQKGIPNPDKYNFYFTQQASAGVALRHKMAETAETFKLLMEKKIEAEAQTAAARQAEFDLLKESLAARGAPAASMVRGCQCVWLVRRLGS